MLRAPLLLPCFVGLAGSVAAQTFYEPPIAPDLDPSPTVVEYQLTAAETTWEFTSGVETTVWAYNGSTPGPTLLANVGDTIRVHFQNDLPDPTTIHWHGLETPATVDGAHIAQTPIQPGGSFLYEWTAINAGMHWYHPHVQTNSQVEAGLHGVIIVRDPVAEAALGFNTIEEHVLVFDDVLLDAENEIVPAFSFTDPLQNAIYQLNGREGNLLLVNGREAAKATLTVPNGEPQRWRVVNVANSTFCRLELLAPEVGLRSTVYAVGVDGGFTEKPEVRRRTTSTAPGTGDGPGLDHPGQALVPEMSEGIFLMPGERMDVIFTPIGLDGQTFQIFQEDWYRGRHTASYDSLGNIVLGIDPLDGLYPRQKYLDLVVQGPDPGTGEFVPPATLRTFEPWTVTPKGMLPLMMGHGLPDPVTGDVILFNQAEMISGMMSPLPTAKVTSLKAHDVEVNDVWQWEVINMTHGDHPFHTHGFAFEPIEYEFFDSVTPLNNYVFPLSENRRFKDTIRIPPRLGAKGTSKCVARLRVSFSDTGREGTVVAHGEQATYDETGAWTSGGWLAHCHILEHSARGMLTFFEVRDPADPFHLLGRFNPSTLGNPSLTASGDLSPGSAVTFTIVDGMPNSTMYLCAGNIAANRTLYGATFVPGLTKDGTTVLPKPLFARIFTFQTDGNGFGQFTMNGWEAAPPGTPMYWQAAMHDPGIPGRWAYTNALYFARP